MLQRKKAHEDLRQPPMPTNKTPPTSAQLMPSSPLYPPDSSSSDKGARETKNKEIKKPRGSRMASTPPNYMKSTTCSDARKERSQSQVAPPSPAIAYDEVKTSDMIASTSDSKASSCSAPVTKTLKSLARKASLRPRRPSMKKSSATALSPRKSMRQATCSSTLKDSKFPKVLDLNPGEKEAELTSIIKVCPFDYCSLNGRRHQHSHPLKRLPSARRQPIKTQKSVILKRLVSVRGRSFRRGRMSISSGKTKKSQGLRINPIIKEVSDDFSVEIYAKPQEKDTEYSNCEKKIKGQELIDRELSKILRNLESMEDDVDVDFSEEETEQFNRRMSFIDIHEIYNQLSFGDDLDQSSDISFDDMYDDDTDIPYDQVKEKTLFSIHENHEIWEYQCCGVNVEEPENSKENFPIKAHCLQGSGEEGSKNLSEKTILSDGLLVQGIGSLSSNMDSIIPTKQHGDVIDTHSAQMESCDSIDLERPTLDVVNPIIAEARLGEGGNGKGSPIRVIHSITLEDKIVVGKPEDSNAIGSEKGKCKSDDLFDAETRDDKDEENNANAFGSEKSEQDVLEESELAADSHCPDNLNLSIDMGNGTQNDKDQETIATFKIITFEEEPEESKFITDDGSIECIDLRVFAEDAEPESAKAEENSICLSRFEGLEESELAIYVKGPNSTDIIYLNNVADDAGTGLNKNENNDAFCIKRYVPDGLQVSKLATDGEEENINVYDASKKAEPGESELARDDECAESIVLGSSESETAESDDNKEYRLSSGDERPDGNLKISKEYVVGNENPRDHKLNKVEFSGCGFEIYDVHQDSSTGKKIPDSISINSTEETNSDYNQISENHRLEDNGVSSDNILSDNPIIAGETRCSETPEVCNTKKVNRRRSTCRSMIEMEMLRLINPRAPHFLSLNPDPEDEKVDLRHQLMDERKSQDAWMIDSALQRVVKKLAPARKRKVALLIEAFEAVTPYDSILMSPNFWHKKTNTSLQLTVPKVTNKEQIELVVL